MKQSPALRAVCCVLTETAAAFTGAVSYQAGVASQRLWERASEMLTPQADCEADAALEVPAARQGAPSVLQLVPDPGLASVTRLPRPRDPRDLHPAGKRGHFDDDLSPA